MPTSSCLALLLCSFSLARATGVVGSHRRNQMVRESLLRREQYKLVTELKPDLHSGQDSEDGAAQVAAMEKGQENTSKSRPPPGFWRFYDGVLPPTKKLLQKPPRSRSSCDKFGWKTDIIQIGVETPPDLQLAVSDVCAPAAADCKGYSTQEKAAKFCHTLGARLCTKNELNLHEESSRHCLLRGFLKKPNVWTSTPCKGGHYAGHTCTPSTEKAYYGRCCADAEAEFVTEGQAQICKNFEQTALWHEGGYEWDTKFTTQVSCANACSRDPSCQYYFWKNEPGRLWQYHCAGFTKRCEITQYNDGYTSKLYKRKMPALCQYIAETSWDGNLPVAGNTAHNVLDVTNVIQKGCEVTFTNLAHDWSPAKGVILGDNIYVLGLQGKLNKDGNRLYFQFVNESNGDKISTTLTLRNCTDLSGSWGTLTGDMATVGSDMSTVTQRGCAIEVVDPGRAWSPAHGVVKANTVHLFGMTGRVLTTHLGSDRIAFTSGLNWTRRVCNDVSGVWWLGTYDEVSTFEQNGCSLKVTNPARSWSPARGKIFHNKLEMFGVLGTHQGNVIFFENGAAFQRRLPTPDPTHPTPSPTPPPTPDPPDTEEPTYWPTVEPTDMPTPDPTPSSEPTMEPTEPTATPTFWPTPAQRSLVARPYFWTSPPLPPDQFQSGGANGPQSDDSVDMSDLRMMEVDGEGDCDWDGADKKRRRSILGVTSELCRRECFDWPPCRYAARQAFGGECRLYTSCAGKKSSGHWKRWRKNLDTCWQEVAGQMATYVLPYSTEYGCSDYNQQCSWDSRRTAMEQCLRWQECEAIYCSTFHQVGFHCYARKKDKWKLQPGAKSFEKMPCETRRCEWSTFDNSRIGTFVKVDSSSAQSHGCDIRKTQVENQCLWPSESQAKARCADWSECQAIVCSDQYYGGDLYGCSALRLFAEPSKKKAVPGEKSHLKGKCEGSLRDDETTNIG